LITIKCIYDSMTTIHDGKPNQPHPLVAAKLLTVANVISTAKSLEPGNTKGNESLREWPVLVSDEFIMNQDSISKYTAPNKRKPEWIPAVDLRCKRAKTLILVNSSKAPAPQVIVKQEHKDRDQGNDRRGGGQNGGEGPSRDHNRGSGGGHYGGRGASRDHSRSRDRDHDQHDRRGGGSSWERGNRHISHGTYSDEKRKDREQQARVKKEDRSPNARPVKWKTVPGGWEDKQM
jgi:hypothetical protein